MKNLKNELDANRELVRATASTALRIGSTFNKPAPKREKKQAFSFRALFKTGKIGG